MPTIVLWDSAPAIEEMGESIFAIGPWAPDTGEKASRFALTNLKAKKAIVISNQHDWGLTVSRYFTDDFKSKGGEILSHEILNGDIADFRATLLKVKAKNPDVIYAPLTFGITSFATQLRQLKITVPIIMSDIITEALLDTSNGVLENFYHTAVVDPQSDRILDLKSHYKKKYGKDLKLPLFTSWGYDAVSIFAEALSSGARSKTEIRDAIYKIINLKGASGTITFNPRGSSPMYISMFQVKNSKLAFIEGPDAK